jgi:multidrug efflux pump subunit AcrB
LSNAHHGDAGPRASVFSALIRKPHLVLVSCFLTLILGLLSLSMLPKDLLPVANMPAVQILTFYPGMPVDRVERNISAASS